MNDLPLLKSLPPGHDERLIEVGPLVIEALQVHIWTDAREHDPYQLVLQKLHKFIWVQSVSLLVRNGTDEQLELRAVTDVDKDDLPVEKYGASESFSGSALQNKEVLLVNSIVNDPRVHQKSFNWWSDHLHPFRLKHGIFVPIFGDLELVCVLRFFNRLTPAGELSEQGFTERDKNVLQLLGTLAAVQLNKIWLADRLKITSEAISCLHGHSLLREVADEAARAAVRLGEGAAGAVFLPDQVKDNTLALVGSYGFRKIMANISIPMNKSLLGRVVKTGEALEVFDLQSASDASSLGPGKREGMASFVAFPLGTKVRDSAKKLKTKKTEESLSPGTLVVYAKVKRHFDRSTWDLLQQFTLSISGIIDNHRRARQSAELRGILPLVAHSIRSPMQRLWFELEKIEARFGTDLTTARSYHELTMSRFDTMLLSKKGLIGVAGLQLSNVSLYDVIKGVVDRYKPTLKRGLRITLRDFSGLPRLRGDAAKLDLLFDNLIENAVKYSHRHREISISAEEVGANIRASVSDQGLGIPENMREKIFESFVRSDILDRERQIKGTGLGLYVSKLIVEAHRGNITFKSTPFVNDPERILAYDGYDTTFIVSLPIERTP
jgi:signal transduction histidine kinase